MSDDMPFDIQIEIMKLLPIKSLVQFISVSKPWKSLIESSDFIADYTVRSRDQLHHLLIRYQTNLSCENDVYVLIEDNDTDTLLHNNKCCITVVPLPDDLLSESLFVSTSHGLVCVMSPYYKKLDGSRKEAVVWNPSIRKSVAIAMPDDVTHSYAIGFGVCRATSEAKFVKINKSVTWQVEVYSLTWRVWRLSPCNPPDTLVDFESLQTEANGFIYWFGNTSDHDGLVIISFDLLSEEFGEIDLPDTLAFHHDLIDLDLFNRNDSLAVSRCIVYGKYEVWVMENGVSKSFMKLFTINEPSELLQIPSIPLEFRRNGEIMMVVVIDDDDAGVTRLAVYQPLSGHMNDLGIKAINYSLLVSPYTESLLLLLDQ